MLCEEVLKRFKIAFSVREYLVCAVLSKTVSMLKVRSSFIAERKGQWRVASGTEKPFFLRCTTK